MSETADELWEGHTLLKTGVLTDTQIHTQTHKSENSSEFVESSLESPPWQSVHIVLPCNTRAAGHIVTAVSNHRIASLPST